MTKITQEQYDAELKAAVEHTVNTLPADVYIGLQRFTRNHAVHMFHAAGATLAEANALSSLLSLGCMAYAGRFAIGAK